MAETEKPTGKGAGILVLLFAILIGVAPYVGKAYLRRSIPSLNMEKLKSPRRIADSTIGFLGTQMHEIMQKALQDGDQLAAHCPSSKKVLGSFRHSMTVLDELHAKYEQGMKLWQECESEADKCSMLKWELSVREKALTQAEQFHVFMMSVITVIASVFLVTTMRSLQVPSWAKYFSMITAGAVIAGWFPL